MAKIRITLSMSEDIVRRAKRLAKKRQTTVSALFSEWVASLDEDPMDRRALGPLTKRARGIAKMPEGASTRELIEESLLRKYKIKE